MSKDMAGNEIVASNTTYITGDMPMNDQTKGETMEKESTFEIKPATRADVERVEGCTNFHSPFAESLIATLESWWPLIEWMAAQECKFQGSPDCGCESCVAKKLKEDWNA